MAVGIQPKSLQVSAGMPARGINFNRPFNFKKLTNSIPYN